MIVPLEKPGSPEELVHFGIKGMKWGVRKAHSGSDKPKTANEIAIQKAHRKQLAKKVAIGTGALLVVAGTAYVGYKLHQSGHLPLSKVKRSSVPVPEVKKVLSTPTDVIYNSKGQTGGLKFFAKGGVPDYFSHYEQKLGKYAHSSERDIFERFPDGTVITRFLDPLNRRDESNRPITHEAIIPKIMAEGLTSNADVLEKIWPHLQKVYDPT